MNELLEQIKNELIEWLDDVWGTPLESKEDDQRVVCLAKSRCDLVKRIEKDEHWFYKWLKFQFHIRQWEDIKEMEVKFYENDFAPIKRYMVQKCKVCLKYRKSRNY